MLIGEKKRLFDELIRLKLSVVVIGQNYSELVRGFNF